MFTYPRYDERPDLVERWREKRDPFPGMEWMDHDPVCDRYWDSLCDDFGDFQFLVYDDDNDAVLGEGRAIPFRWSGKDDELPDGVDEVFPLACESGEAPNTLCAILAVVDPDIRSRGVSYLILERMKALASAHSLAYLVAPVRPNFKHRYPLSSMESYARWRREDGLLFDPWLRTHERLGARYAGICPNSNFFIGTVAQWGEWTGLRFFESGDYLVGGMINPLRIDLEADRGIYTEPNVWMVHRLP